MSGVPVLMVSSLDDFGIEAVNEVQSAARKGRLLIAVPTDELHRSMHGSAPRFPLAERLYLARALRGVSHTIVLESVAELEAVTAGWLEGPVGEPVPERTPLEASTPRVLVTGCYDWLHSGHVSFFAEGAAFGELVVSVGNDASVTAHKGPGHPLFPASVRRDLVASIRHVSEAVVSSGDGWLDIEPDLPTIRPDLWVVNEDGDRPEKRALCAELGIDYRVLRREPAEGLPVRTSTELRGF